VLSGRDLCDELITRPEESYRVWCVVVCDLETSRMRRPDPCWVAAPQQKKNDQKHTAFAFGMVVDEMFLYFYQSKQRSNAEDETPF